MVFEHMYILLAAAASPNWEHHFPTFPSVLLIPLSIIFYIYSEHIGENKVNKAMKLVS